MDGRRTVGVLRNVWRYLTKVRPAEKAVTRELVGVDKSGNKYFCILKDQSVGGREERIIEPSDKIYGDNEHITSYGMDMQIPNEWTLWLRGTRKYPPTPEEIERNEINRMKMAEKVRKLEMKEAEERLGLPEDSGKADDSAPLPIAQDVRGSTSNPNKVPFPKYGGTFEIAPGVSTAKDKEPND